MSDQRRKIDFARHLKKVATSYPEAERITVILDNLNTHNESSFYEAFSAEEAFALSQKFEFVSCAAKSKLAKYGRDRVFGNLSTVFEQTRFQLKKT